MLKPILLVIATTLIACSNDSIEAMSQPEQMPQTAQTASQSTQEISTINETLTQIESDKESLKQLLTQIDSEIEKGKSLVLQARKKSMDILKQTEIKEAQAINSSINQELQTITKIQQDLQSGPIREIDTIHTKINNSIQNVQNLISQLQAKDVARKVADLQMVEPLIQPQPQSQSQSGTSQEPAFQSWLVPKKDESPAQQPQATFVHYLFNRLANLITDACGIIYNTYTAIKNSLFQQSTTSEAPTTAPTDTQPQEATDPAWKKEAIRYFSISIDGLISLFGGIKHYCGVAYNEYIVPFFTQVSADVSKKMKQEKSNTTAEDQGKDTAQ